MDTHHTLTVQTHTLPLVEPCSPRGYSPYHAVQTHTLPVMEPCSLHGYSPYHAVQTHTPPLSGTLFTTCGYSPYHASTDSHTPSRGTLFTTWILTIPCSTDSHTPCNGTLFSYMDTHHTMQYRLTHSLSVEPCSLHGWLTMGTVMQYSSSHTPSSGIHPVHRSIPDTHSVPCK